MTEMPLRLTMANAAVANRATASVLLLYYHLLREGGITADQTVYVDPDDFDPFAFLSAEVSEDLADVDASLLREGAIVHLLCDLNDLVGEHEDDPLGHSLTKRILSAAAAGRFEAVPEAVVITSLVAAGEARVRYPELREGLARVYERYVVARFRALLNR